MKYNWFNSCLLVLYSKRDRDNEKKKNREERERERETEREIEGEETYKGRRISTGRQFSPIWFDVTIN